MIKDDDVLSGVLPPLDPNTPHSEEYGSFEDKLVACVSHDYILFKDDNTKVHYYLEEAARITQCKYSIKSCQREKNGRDA